MSLSESLSAFSDGSYSGISSSSISYSLSLSIGSSSYDSSLELMSISLSVSVLLLIAATFFGDLIFFNLFSLPKDQR